MANHPRRATYLRLIASLGLLLVTAWPTPTEANERQTVRTDHLVIQWNGGDATDEEVELARTLGEAFFTAISKRLGHEPDHQIYLSLEGSAQRPDGSWGYPRVDGWGRILLYRFAANPESYFNALAHEMVHVFRLGRRPHHDWFLEEGFAEFVARRVDDSTNGFPWYGFPLTIVAGHLVVRGEDIPLTELQARHDELNQPCTLQSYALRGAFFDWLGRTYGDEKVIAFAQAEKAGDLGAYPEFFDSDLGQLATRWREELMSDFRTIGDAEEQALRYRERSPAQYQRVCQRGEDF